MSGSRLEVVEMNQVKKAKPAGMGDWFDHDYDDDSFDDNGDCGFCGGDGWLDGYEDDPLWFEPGEMARCASCGGTGRAKDMTIW